MEDRLKVVNNKSQMGSEIFWSRLKRRVLRHTLLLRAGLIFVVLLFVFGLVLITAKTFKDKGVFKYVHLTSNFLIPPKGILKSYNERTNVLILGKGGLGHEAPDLTDTIILMSVSGTMHTIETISLPRDIWIPELRAKLNSAYYWGEQKGAGMGLLLAKSTIEEITGVPIHYAFVINFASFEKIIDAVDGIEVNVKNGFVDEKYPIAGKENDECGSDLTYNCRYERIEFKDGYNYMDGATTLKFVRSRNSKGEEGTDFARAARQELVISALKNKILSKEVIFSPNKLLKLRRVLADYLETDIDIYEAAVFARKIFDARKNITGFVLPEELLETPPISPKYDNLYVFIPKAQNWDEIKYWISSKFI